MVKTNSGDLSPKEEEEEEGSGSANTTFSSSACTATTSSSNNNDNYNVLPTEDVVLIGEEDNSNVKNDNTSDEVLDIEDVGDDEDELPPSTTNNEKLRSSSSSLVPILQTPATTTNNTTTTNSLDNQHKHLELPNTKTPPKQPPTKKIIKTYPQYKTQMEEVFSINIRPITPSKINNFYSEEFAVPGGNSTKIYRMDSSTLICSMLVDWKFDSKSKYVVLF